MRRLPKMKRRLPKISPKAFGKQPQNSIAGFIWRNLDTTSMISKVEDHPQRTRWKAYYRFNNKRSSDADSQSMIASNSEMFIQRKSTANDQKSHPLQQFFHSRTNACRFFGLHRAFEIAVVFCSSSRPVAQLYSVRFK